MGNVITMTVRMLLLAPVSPQLPSGVGLSEMRQEHAQAIAVDERAPTLIWRNCLVEEKNTVQISTLSTWDCSSIEKQNKLAHVLGAPSKVFLRPSHYLQRFGVAP